ncbi:hypothetical protein ACQJBY_039868 [Aegilops geniculata]
MAGKEADFRWMEVQYINFYSLFMAYLLMAVRGLGYLVLAWTTVVLLGGFVTKLEKKDFWSLTVITLILTPRVSADVDLKGKLKYIGESVFGLYRAISATLNPNGINDPWLSRLLAGVVFLCHLLVAPIVVCPLAALYVCGPLLSAGISVWRLIERDYGVEKKQEADNLQPALIVLYSLATLQGLLFCYRFYSSFAREDLVKDVAEVYKMNDVELVEEYLRDTMAECEKDPAFFKERNLATYAVGMIECKSSESFLSGARILDSLLEHVLEAEVKAKEELLKHALAAEEHALGVTPETQKALTVTAANAKELAAQLISLASSSHVLKKLLQALDSTSPHGETVRGVAANIVAHVAGRTPLMQFPRVIQRIGSLLDIPRQQVQEDYRKLMEKGFAILLKLAADEDNCRAISDAQGVLSRVMAPVSSDLLHLLDHEAWWSTIVAASLKVMCRLVAAPRESGAQLRKQISRNKEAIHGMEGILNCCRCGEQQLHILSIEILTKLHTDEDSLSGGVNKQSRGNYIVMLASIFTDASKPCSIRELAGEALVKLSQSESDAAIILKANDYVVHDLSNILLLHAVDNNTKRIIAAKTLKHLYIHYKENDDYLNILTKTMEDVVPKVLREILPVLGLEGKETPLAENGTDNNIFLFLGTPDIEAQQVGAAQDDNSNNKTFPRQQNDPRKVHAALLSLVTVIFDKLIIQDRNLAQLIDKISPGDSPSSFGNKLKEMVMVWTNSEPMESCLSIMKNASKMVISMMKHNDSCLNGDFLKIFIQYMSKGCKTTSCLEGSMILDKANRGTVKPYRTLTSLVKEAQELLVTKEPKER